MRTGLAACALAALLACDRAREPAAPEWPAGTVLAVDGRPITAEEVDEAARRVALIYPARSRRFHRTRALESFVLPREALRSAYPKERERARAACEEARARLLAGADPAEVGAREGSGGPGTLSVFLWDAARRLEPGVWSEPLERIGIFSLVQLVERSGFEIAEAEEEVVLRAVDVPYVPAGFDPDALDAALSAARLEVVDPEWEAFLPERLRYQMRGGS